MEFTDFLTCASLFQKFAPVNLPIFVHHCKDEKESFFDYHTATENSGNENWNVLLIKMVDGWAVFDNIGPADSMSISCTISSDISPPNQLISRLFSIIIFLVGPICTCMTFSSLRNMTHKDR